jgi:tetratricopeptide (TPR) repeat protein
MEAKSRALDAGPVVGRTDANESDPTTHGADAIQEILARSTSEQVATIAESWNDSGDVAAAVRLLEAAVHSEVTHAGLWHNLGTAEAALGQHAGAIDAYTHAIRDGYPSFVSRGLSYEQLEDWGAARNDYLSALELDPKDVDALVDLGTLELSLGRAAEAAVRLSAAASLDPQANWQLADAYLARNKIAEAKDALLEAIDAGELRANLDLARLEVEVASPTTVESYFVAAIAANSSLARREFVIYLDNQGDTERALTVALEGVEEGDKNCYAPLAVIYESLGELDLAVQYYTLAVQDGEDVYEEDLAKLLAVTTSRKRH